jgi:transposase-like protein
MTQDHSALLAQLDALKSADASAVFAELIRAGLQQLIEAEATAAIGADRYQRTEGRAVHRNGHRPKTVSTTSGDIEVQIPKLRVGSFFPSLLERRRRVDQALFAMVMVAYLHGVSTRKVDDLVKALGADTGISPPLLERGAVEAFEALPLVCGRQGRVRLWTVPVAARAAANGRER